MKNHNLIYGLANKEHIDLEEFYDVLALGLCIAVDTYDETKGAAFSTYAYAVMLNEYRNELRMLRKFRANQSELLSLDEPVKMDAGGETDDTFVNIIPAVEKGVEAAVSDKMIVEDVLNGIPKKTRDAVNLIALSVGQKQIADMFGVSKQAVSARLKCVRDRWNPKKQETALV